MIAKDIAIRKVQEAVEKIRPPPKMKKFYGQPIGILVLDIRMPRIPGDIGNATTFPFPVRYQVIKGVTDKDIVCSNPDVSVGQRVIEEAKILEEEGVSAIATSCGYFAYFQDEIAAAVDVPVFASSLIQVPLVSKMLGKNKKIGIICASTPTLSTTHLRKAGIDESIPVVVAGLDKYWSMVRGQNPKSRLHGFEKGVSTVAKQIVSKNPDVGAIVLECTNLPPAAAAVQEATGLPVFDMITLTYMIHDVVARKRYIGHM